MTTNNPDPLEVWKAAVHANLTTEAEPGEKIAAAAAIIAQHYAPVIAENERLEALVGELGEALVTAMIPIEAMLLSGADAAHCQDVRDAMHDAQATARATLAKLEKARG